MALLIEPPPLHTKPPPLRNQIYRAYTPIRSNFADGHFDLLIKVYQPCSKFPAGGIMTQVMFHVPSIPQVPRGMRDCASELPTVPIVDRLLCIIGMLKHVLDPRCPSRAA
jgi:hypothetical protein